MINNLEHFCLFGLLYLISFSLLLYKPERIQAKFWGSVWLFVAAYSIIVGCRYGWGHDYLSYKDFYNHVYFEEGRDYGYYLLNYVENALGISFEGHILLCAFFYIISSYYLVKKTGVANAWMLVLFMPVTIMFSTYAIRQFLAISFLYLFIGYFLFDEKKKSVLKIVVSIILIGLAYSIHAASIIFILPFLLFIIYKNVKALNYIVVIVSYIIVIFFTRQFSEFLNNWMSENIQIISLDNHFQSYIEQSDKWFGEDAENEETFGYGGIYQYFSYLSNLAIIYLSGRTLSVQNNKNVSMVYNVFAIAIIIREIFFEQEIMRRIIDPYVIMAYVPLGYGIYNTMRFERKFIYILALAFALLGIYYPQYKFLINFSLADFMWNH